MSRAKLYFHLALGGLFFPVVGLPAALGMGLAAAFDGNVPQAERPSHRRWTRALFGLVALDILLVVLLVTQLGGLQSPSTMGTAPPRVTLGVQVEEGSSPPKLREVFEGGASARAGLRKGDVVRRVGEVEVQSLTELRAQLSTLPPGDSAEVEIEREGSVQHVPVTFTSPVTPELFEPVGGQSCTPEAGLLRRNLLFPLAGALVVFGLYVWGRRRGMDATLLWAALLLVGVSVGASAATFATCMVVGGRTTGGFLMGLLAQTVLLIAGGLFLWRRARRAGWVHRAERTPTLPWLHTAALGIWYGLTGALRVGILVLVMTSLTSDASAGPFGDSPLHALAQGGELGVAGWALFLLPVVLLGPIGEDLLFRGALLPWLAGFLPKGAAVVLSASLFAVLHLYYGAFVLLILWYGVVLGWARLASGGLKAPIALHVAMNGTAALVMLFRGG